MTEHHGHQRHVMNHSDANVLRRFPAIVRFRPLHLSHIDALRTGLQISSHESLPRNNIGWRVTAVQGMRRDDSSASRRDARILGCRGLPTMRRGPLP